MNLWNLYAKYYDVFRSNPVSKAILRSEQRSIANLLLLRDPNSTKGRALDLGMGRGNCLEHIPSDFSHVYAIDKSPEMVALARKKFEDVDFCVGDVCQTPYENKSMDLILCVGVSEYVAELDQLLTEIKRILHESGCVIFTSSPPTLLNQIRILFGHRLFLRTQRDTIEIIKKNDLILLIANQTAIQD